MSELFWIAVVVMMGTVLSVAAWQLLAIGRIAARHSRGPADETTEEFRRRIEALERNMADPARDVKGAAP
jgi:hypothetical protein